VADKEVIAFPEIAAVSAAAPGEEHPGLTAVQQFLQRFGYLGTQQFEPGKLDDQTSDALAKFQSFHGIEATGEFDEQTKDQMTEPRCAHPDMASGIAFSTQCAWNKTTLGFAFDVTTTDVAGTGPFDAIRSAFATWASVVGFTFNEVAASASPDILIGWRPANDPDLSMVGGTLAHADFPPGCSVVTNSLPKPVHFDDSEHTWAVGASTAAFDIETVAVHELGHILGLAHSAVPGAVMSPTVAPNFTLRALTADDTSGIQSLYPGVTPVTPKPATTPVPFPGRLLRFPPLTTGEDVRSWQTRMNERGFGLDVDAKYGKNSKAACRTFQQQQTIQADGIVGPVTWERTFAPI